MACTARLYEVNGAAPSYHAALTATSVQVLAIDQGRLSNLCSIQSNGRLPTTGMGVQLPFIPRDIVYQVAVSDLAGVYAGFTVLNLNGGVAGDIDLVVHRLPTGSRAGSTANIGSPAQARTAVLATQIWTSTEKAGVLGLMSAYSYLLPSTDPLVKGFVRQYASALDTLGIDPSIF